ncbi:hypothetical protein [Nocardia sp. NBC_00403]|uniref:hypothetical protein n=1 Tax=Nocardia sp. NBC_00403 TaxID=2975990 RepID=UPI002E1E966E
MTSPIRIMQNATKRVADGFLAVAKHTPESHFGAPLGEVATELGGADFASSRNILVGTDPLTGKSRSFEIGDIESFPLADSSGKVIGVGFPTRQDENWVNWARADQRWSDRCYSTSEPVAVENPDGSRRLEFPEAKQAPWDSGEGQPPTYVFAHGTPDGEVAVRIPSESGETANILVDKPSFGRILAANRHYRQAIEENSRKTVAAGCYADSADAEAMASELWAAGIDTEVYAFKPATATLWWNDPTNSRVAGSWLSATTSHPSEQELLTDPITHYAPSVRKIDDSG